MRSSQAALAHSLTMLISQWQTLRTMPVFVQFMFNPTQFFSGFTLVQHRYLTDQNIDGRQHHITGRTGFINKISLLRQDW